MQDNNKRRPSGLLAILLLILIVFSPPLGLVAWIVAAGPDRVHYLRSNWVRTGFGIMILCALPLLAIIILAEVGMWPDPNPNPIGPGLLFFAGLVLGSVCLAVGIVRVRFAPT